MINKNAVSTWTKHPVPAVALLTVAVIVLTFVTHNITEADDDRVSVNTSFEALAVPCNTLDPHSIPSC